MNIRQTTFRLWTQFDVQGILTIVLSVFFLLVFIGTRTRDVYGTTQDGEKFVQNNDQKTPSGFEASQNDSHSGATWRDVSTEWGTDASNLTNQSFNDGKNDSFVGPKTTRFSYDLNQLPNNDGQYWIVYDISPYTERFPKVKEPQNSIVDWILFDSGKELWRKEPFCVLSSTRDRLYVYHNSSVQRYVSNVVDRFIDPNKRNASFSIKIVVLQSPEWRVRLTSYLSPLDVKLVGNGCDVQCWTIDRANMAKITAELEKRTDYALLNRANYVTPNGETFGWVAPAPRHSYVRDYRPDPQASSGYTTDVGAVDEGLRIETTPLLSLNGETLEVGFRYSSTVVEKTRSFGLRVPTSTAPRQQLEVERPQIVSCDVSGKVSFSRHKAAIVDLGLTPMPELRKNNEQSGGLAESVSNLVTTKSAFCNVLIMIEALD